MSDETPPSNKVLMYSSSLCPYCMMAKRLFSQKAVEVEIRCVDGNPALRSEMVQRSGRSSVPQIFIDGAHVGGCDDLYALDSNGKLDAMLYG